MKLLLIDDDAEWLAVLKENCQDAGFCCDAFVNPVAAIEAYRQRPEEYDVILTDLVMPELDGIALLKKVREVIPGSQAIVMSACNNVELIGEAAGSRIQSFLPKPISFPKLFTVLKQIEQEVSQQRKETEEKNLLVKEYIKLRREYGETQVLVKKYEALLETKK